MPKAKKAPARPARHPVPSLPPEFLEQAAQGWLQSHGIAATAPTEKRKEIAFSQLSESLDKVLQQLQAELNELRSRVARLESKKS
jgi:hypothetical protein